MYFKKHVDNDSYCWASYITIIEANCKRQTRFTKYLLSLFQDVEKQQFKRELCLRDSRAVEDWQAWWKVCHYWLPELILCPQKYLCSNLTVYNIVKIGTVFVESNNWTLT